MTTREALEPILSFLDELAVNAEPGKREALNPILIDGSAKLYAEGLRKALRREAQASSVIGDAATLRGFIETYKMTPSMMASEMEIWKERALAAAPSRPDAGGGVRVKPLEWSEYEREGDIDEWEAETAFGTFYAVKRHAFCFMPSCDGSHIQYKGQQSPEEAKAVCQADYEQRILSALSTPPAAAESNASVEARLREAFLTWINKQIEATAAQQKNAYATRNDRVGEKRHAVQCALWETKRKFEELSAGGDEARFKHFAPDGGKAPIRPDAPDHLTIKTSAELAIAVGDEAKKSEGGVEGHAKTQTGEHHDTPGAQAEGSPVESPLGAAGIKPGPSDPTAERREIVARLRKLIATATLLYQNAVGCAANHHSVDFEQQGLPGWLADCERDIRAASAALDGGR